MDKYREGKISINGTLLRKIVYSIEKAIGEDQQQYNMKDFILELGKDFT